MDIKEAINARHSVRQYLNKPIDADLVQKLNGIIEECNKESGLHIQLALDEPKCFTSLLAHYGNFTGVRNYIALVGKKNMENLEETAGYYGERIVLEAQMMGLNTCWVAGTYNKRNCKAQVESGEEIVCVIAIGYGESQGKEHNSKLVSKVCDVAWEDMPDWFKEGLDAAMKAPTAINQQRFNITLRDGEPVITAKRGPLTKIDLGIVKYNFEAASGHKCL